MEIILINIAITTVVIVSLFMGEICATILPELSPFFNYKPFNCRACLTFHLHWIGMAIIALIFQSWEIALSGIITAFLVFAAIKYKENKMVIK